MPSRLDYYTTNQGLLHRPYTPVQRRGPIGAEFSSPGPAIVSLPSSFGIHSNDGRMSKAPAYTFGSKYEEKNDFKTPGPGEYSVEGCTRIGKDWSPTVFMSPRYKEPERFSTPGPCEYSPERSTRSVKGQAPSYTFGFKANEPAMDVTPPPTAYNVPEPEAYKNVKPPSATFGFKASPYALSF